MTFVAEEKAREVELARVLRNDHEQETELEQLPEYQPTRHDPRPLPSLDKDAPIAGPSSTQSESRSPDPGENEEQFANGTTPSSTQKHGKGFKTFAIYNDKSLRTFAFWNGKSLTNFRIHAGRTSDDPVAFYVRSIPFTPKTPDVLLHEGDGELGPVRATAKFYTLSIKGDITLAIGNGCERNLHASSSSTPGFTPAIYEEMKKNSVVAHTEYSFSTDLTRDGSRKQYDWKRKPTGKFLCWDYECTEHTENQKAEIVARFENAGLSYSKSGDFRFLRSEGQKWEWLILIAWLSIREKESRFAVYHGVTV